MEEAADKGVSTALEKARALHDNVRLATERLGPIAGSKAPQELDRDKDALNLIRGKLEQMEDLLRECRLSDPTNTQLMNSIMSQLDTTRKDLIAASRESLRFVGSCQDVFKDVLNFCEMEQQETITPRNFPSWTTWATGASDSNEPPPFDGFTSLPVLGAAESDYQSKFPITPYHAGLGGVYHEGDAFAALTVLQNTQHPGLHDDASLMARLCKYPIDHNKDTDGSSDSSKERWVAKLHAAPRIRVLQDAVISKEEQEASMRQPRNKHVKQFVLGALRLIGAVTGAGALIAASTLITAVAIGDVGTTLSGKQHKGRSTEEEPFVWQLPLFCRRDAGAHGKTQSSTAQRRATKQGKLPSVPTLPHPDVTAGQG
eukprot:jgi/Chrzof1/13918/Cz08g17120.t1